MNVRITNSKAFDFLRDVNLNSVFNAKDNCHSVAISSDQLVKAGADKFILEDSYWYFSKDEVIEVDDTPCDVTNKCCNQFGERDEIQAIIDKLHADVAERDERIKVLEDECDELYTLAQDPGVCSEFLKVNFACSWGER